MTFNNQNQSTKSVEKISRWKNFKIFFCSKWAKKPKKQHVFFVFLHTRGVGGWVRSKCVILHTFFEPFPYHKILRSNCVELDFKEISYLVLASVQNFLDHCIGILYQSFFFKISSPIFQKNLTPNIIGPKHILNTFLG